MKYDKIIQAFKILNYTIPIIFYTPHFLAAQKGITVNLHPVDPVTPKH